MHECSGCPMCSPEMAASLSDHGARRFQSLSARYAGTTVPSPSWAGPTAKKLNVKPASPISPAPPDRRSQGERTQTNPPPSLADAIKEKRK